MARRPSPAPRVAARIVAFVVVLLAGIWLGGHPSWLPSAIRSAFVSDSGGRLVDDVLDTLSRDYYRPINRSALVNDGLGAIIASLHDPYSHYYNAADYKSFLGQSNPHLSGIGIDVVPEAAGLRVADVFPDSPAARAGLAHGDLILKVGSTSLAGRAGGFAEKLIRGPAGTSVHLTIARGKSVRELSIVRANVVIPVASGTIVRYHGIKLGYLQLTAFTSGSGGELRADTQKMLHQGARALILDLRDNGGGLLDEAINVASIYIPDGTIVSTRGRSQPTQVYTATGHAISTSIPMTVLVNRDTASAAEIVTAALQDRGRAKIIGTRTYGKGVFQEIEPLPGGSALDITVGEYFTPNGRNLGGGGVREGQGIKPNIYVSDQLHARSDPVLAMAERTVASELP